MVISTALFACSAYANTAKASIPQYVIDQFGSPPSVPLGKFSEELETAVNLVFNHPLGQHSWTEQHTKALEVIAESKDPRLAWPVSDLMRFSGQGTLTKILTEAASQLLNITIDDSRHWGATTDHLIAWDIPAPPNYLALKRNIFTSLIPGWEQIFKPGDIDWRHVSWGGVLIDNRSYDTTDDACNCIPAADNPTVTSASDAEWLNNNDIVFGIEVNGEYRAYPRRIMEVREMVNDTLGGRDLAIPYCTLCGAAQAYFTDQLPAGVQRPILRTSGLLIRSNKVMYDVNTYSVFDTFKGNAVTGELAEKAVQLQQASVITTEWGAWKSAHPETTVLSEELALGRDFDFRNNRDANGPIFPVGNVDPRFNAHEDMVGVIGTDGSPVAFQRSEAIVELSKGNTVALNSVQVIMDGGGVRAIDQHGKHLGSHQAFWFAWSQFYPETLIWPNAP